MATETHKTEKRVYCIALTGGPCSGKTTALNFLFEKLRDRGFRVFITPEVATMVIGGGIPDISKIRESNQKLYLKIEESMFHMQIILENQFHNFASLFPDEPIVILCDRGVKDVQAYMGEENFSAMLEDLNYKISDIYGRYDSVIDLITAADGAEKYYTLENNKARQESSLEEARKADKDIQNAWTGFPHVWPINNSTNFDLKLKRAFQAICRTIGIPVPIEMEKRYLLKSMPDFNRPDFANTKIQEISIEQMYLLSQNEYEELRIRKRTQQGSSNYYRTIKDRRGDWPIEKESSIGAREYLALQDLKDPNKEIIKKIRHCFIYEHQYFELDYFLGHREGLLILEIELTEENEEVRLPPFLEIVKEITGDKSYSNYELANSL